MAKESSRFTISGSKKEVVVSLKLEQDSDGVVNVMAINNRGDGKCLVQFKEGKLYLISYADMAGVVTLKSKNDRIVTVNQ